MEPNANADNANQNQNTNSGSNDKDTPKDGVQDAALPGATKMEDNVAKPASSFLQLLGTIQEQKTTNQPELNDLVVQQLVKEDKEDKIQILLKGITLYKKQEGETKKINADQEQLDGDGKSTKFYSKARFEELKKAKEYLAKIKKAMELATNAANPDYSKIRELVK